MTTVQINLPDELALNAQQAGLLTPEAIEAMLREQLKKQAGDALRAMWRRAPEEEVTPHIEQLIDEAIQTVRTGQHTRTIS
jgi:hypothetical protein